MERLHGLHFETIRATKGETISWLLWYDRSKMHPTLNYVSPEPFGKDWTDATVAIAA